MKHIVVVALALTALVGLAVGQLKEEAKPEMKIFGGYVTRTKFVVTTSTTLLSCVSTIAQTTQCSGRRKRRSSSLLSDDLTVDEPASKVALEASEGEHELVKREVAEPSIPVEEKDKGRFALLTTFTTVTTTTKTEITATTVSISFHCTPPDGINMPFCQ